VFDNSADDVSITFPSLFRSRRPKKRWESWQVLWRQPSAFLDKKMVESESLEERKGENK